MSATPEVPADDRLRFERAARLFAQIGLAPERAVAQLLRQGFAVAQVRAKYPTLPDDLFVVPTDVSAVTRSTPNTPGTFHPSSGKGAALVPPSAQVFAQRVLMKTIATSSAAATPGAAPITVLPDGLSFQYVPLIQCSFPHADP